MFPTTAPDSLVLYKKVLSSKSLHVAISGVKVFVLIEGDIDLISPSESLTACVQKCHTTHIRPRKNTSVHKRTHCVLNID